MPGEVDQSIGQGRIAAGISEASQKIGEPLFSSSEEFERMRQMTLRELRMEYPLKFQAAMAALGLKKDVPEDFDTELIKKRIWAINNIERFVDAINKGESEVGLYTHQIEVFRDLLEFFEEGYDKGWIKLPTGSGKTAIFSSLAKATGFRTLILAPRKNLIESTAESLERFASGLKSSKFYGDEKSLEGDAVISTYQSLEKLAEVSQESGQEYDLVVCDEAHRALTEHVQESLEKVSENKILIGFTATPIFNEEKQVGNYFGELIENKGY